MSFRVTTPRPIIAISPPRCGTSSMARALGVRRSKHFHVPSEFFQTSAGDGVWEEAYRVGLYREPISRALSWATYRRERAKEKPLRTLGIESAEHYCGIGTGFHNLRPAALYSPREMHQIIRLGHAGDWAEFQARTGLQAKRSRTVGTTGEATWDDEAIAYLSSIYRGELKYFARRDRYRAMWEEFHAAENVDQPWLEEWLGRLPESCPCRGHAAQVLSVAPLLKDSPEWRTLFHDLVNVGLGKPAFGDVPGHLLEVARTWIPEVKKADCAGC